MAFPPVPFQEWFLRQTSTGNAALNAYVARVKADGGVVEAIGCVPLAVWDWTDSFSPTNPVPPTLLLDLYPNAAAAYSLRKLRAAYSGSAVRVRKEVSSVSSETDIGFLADGSLDTTSLLAFASDADSGDVFVVTWYDQSLSNDATQGTAASQPKIVDAGVLVEENGKPAVHFQGVDDFLQLNSALSLSSYSFTFIGSGTSNNQNMLGALTPTAAGTFQVNTVINTIGIQVFDSGGTFAFSNITNQWLSFVDRQVTTGRAYVNGVESTTGSISLPNDFNPSRIANRGGFSYAVFKLQEWVSWNESKASDRTAIEANINTFYSIYP